ncbi:uncharacterized protein F5891DRAFT_1130403 [Suillus fuscotomentosus]|uniref:C2H2-type domain-containing protein n=1 Tax=Suillus fuscotomentosus TaxID=1912939 RepID=A0AAD4HHU2_9AGAM|nr:uncharacterized protein F5891DRAFT_1130403 [Suillus fuscotomentosus]KAG1896024.1 hypothetical protein F5891DRAFT_1130403 [Suillus fuscotomentosus]
MLSRLACSFHGCPETFKSQRGRTKHIHTYHSSVDAIPNPTAADSNPHSDSDPQEFNFNSNHDLINDNYFNNPNSQPEGHSNGRQSQYIPHPHLRGDPCDLKGNPLPPNAPKPARYVGPQDSWAPFGDQAEYLLADFLFCKEEMSAPNIDFLMELWAFKAAKYEEDSPFKSHRDVYATIDVIRAGDVPWQCFSVAPQHNLDSDVPWWQQTEYQVWYQDPDAVIQAMLANPDFAGQFDYSPYVHYDQSGKHRWKDFMSGNYAWRKSDTIYENDPSTEGSMYVGIILGSDKTTVSVATGHVEYHPLYLSIGNPHNCVRRAHHNAVTPIGFLAIPKADRKYNNDVQFRTFKRQLYHSSLAAIFKSLQGPMTKPIVCRCPDGHFRRVIYNLAAFIADYPEQVMLSGIVQNWCAKCTVLPEDLDGSTAECQSQDYTDVLVETFNLDVLWDQYGIDDDIVPFTNDFPRADIHEMLLPDLLHQVIKGCFKDHLVTWMGECLKEVHGEARANDIIDDIDHRIAATPSFPGLCRFPEGRCFKQWTGDDSKALMKVYIPAIVEYVSPQLVECLSAFLNFCYLVRRSELGEDSLAKIKQALQHFHEAREIFCDSGVRPNDFALPCQHSMVHYIHLIQEFGAPNGLCSSITESRHITAVKKSWYAADNQRLDKLAAAHVDFVARGLLPASHAPPPRCSVDVTMGEGIKNDAPDIERVQGSVILARTPQRGYPRTLETLAVHLQQPNLPLLARDDVSGTHGMHREVIRCTPLWCRKHARYDCVFVVEDQEKAGMRGMIIRRVKLLFSFVFHSVTYSCALIDRFSRMGRGPDSLTGMWKVKPEVSGQRGTRVQSVKHVDTILRSAHLIPVFGSGPLPDGFHFTYSLDVFNSYYVNKFADHHSHEIVF